LHFHFNYSIGNLRAGEGVREHNETNYVKTLRHMVNMARAHGYYPFGSRRVMLYRETSVESLKDSKARTVTMIHVYLISVDNNQSA
jgi:hypothetical protein